MKKYWITRIIVVLFTMSVSVAVLPCSIINVHGLFGEITASTVLEDKEQEIFNIKSINYENVKTVKGINIFNEWFEIMITIVFISISANLIKLPRGDTIITLKVRMDN